jgi:uncharacterized Tic20 family protein
MNQMQFQGEMSLQTADERQWGMFLHLSHLANLVLFPLGYIAPIIIWQTKKDQMPALDEHGKEAVNWMITSLILHLVNFLILIVGIILTFFVVGIFVIMINILVFLAISITSLVFSIIAAVKANEGEHWEYPMNIKFLK